MSFISLDFSKQLGGDTFTDLLQADTARGESALLRGLDEGARDLVRVAMAVYVADRGAPRSAGHPSAWFGKMRGRSFHLRVPVRHPEFWTRGETRHALSRTAAYFTGDLWEFEFVPLPAKKPMVGAEPLLKHPLQDPFVGLFSGGLDSYAGVVIHALENPNRSGVLVAGFSNGALLHRQSTVLRLTNERLRGRTQGLTHLPIRHDLRHEAVYQLLGRHVGRLENTQRSRGFLFLALGFAIARTIGVRDVHVYENGPGAINLPYTVSGLGVDYTKAMNPEGLQLMSRFVSELFSEHMTVVNSSLWKTKGEMCAYLGNRGLGELAVRTISCDRFPRQGKSSSEAQCGWCTSCLLRRLSLAAADMEALDKRFANYELDIYQPSVKPSSEMLLPFRAMKTQAERIRSAVGSSNPKEALILEFPELLRIRQAIAEMEGRSIAAVTTDLVNLYQRYLRDWDWFETLPPQAA